MQDEIEAQKLADVRTGLIRIVGKQRKRKLRRRGENVYWDSDLNSHVWRPKQPLKGGQ